MALLFMDGFDVGDADAKWTYMGTAGAPHQGSIATTRFGVGRSLTTNASSSGIYSLCRKDFPASSKIIMGIAKVSLSGITSTRAEILLKGDGGGTPHLSLRTNSDGSVSLYRGDLATLLATSAIGLVSIGTWSYWEISATVADSGGRCIVRLNSNPTPIIDFTGDTKNGGTNATIDALSLGSGTAGNSYAFYWDDCYICNDTGSVNNDFLGDVRVQTVLPTAAGASTQFTPSVGSNWDNVNDAPYVSTTYNSDSVSGHRDTYAMADLLSGTGTIFGVQDNILALKSDAGAASIKAAIKSGGTVYYDSAVTLGTALGSSVAVREVDPATSAAWTVTNVNALEFGAEVA
jgi:hypothetical protein